MSGMWKAIKAFWTAASGLSTAAWLWGLLPAAVTLVITGWFARAEQLPPVLIGLVALAAAGIAYLFYVAFRVERLQREPDFARMVREQSLRNKAKIVADISSGAYYREARASEFPKRHELIVEQLAAPLAAMQEQALTYGKRNLPLMANSRARAEALIAEIPYDRQTVQTVRDFLQACAIASEHHDTADEVREARNDVERIGPELFRAVHEGRAVDRSRIDLPHWCKSEAERREPSPAIAKDESKLEALLARRDDLQQVIAKQNPADLITLILKGYQECIRKFTKTEVIRPHRVAVRLNKWVQDLEQVFGRVGAAFALEVPKPEIPKLDDPDSEGNPPMYRPGNNQQFLAAHKRNLAAYEKARNELLRKADQMKSEIDRLTTEIAVEKARVR
jgi:hypothetical protein